MKQNIQKNRNLICSRCGSSVYDEEPEIQANRLLLKFLLYTLLLFGVLSVCSLCPWVSGRPRLLFGALGGALLLFLVSVGICANTDFSLPWIKYVLMGMMVTVLAAAEAVLGFPVWLLNVLPILYCSVYGSRKMKCFTYGLSVLGMAVSVYGAYVCTPYDRKGLLLGLYLMLPRIAVMLLLGVASNRISVIIQQLVEKSIRCRQMAEADMMTGLHNRNKYMEDCASERWAGKAVAVFFWDVNNLKKVNDCMGHEHGDILLREVADSIRAIMNPRCTGYRIGGDEFVLVLSDASREEAELLLACWRNCIETKTLAFEMPVSVAVGCAYGDGGRLEELVREADREMYRDKTLWKQKNNSDK